MLYLYIYIYIYTLIHSDTMCGEQRANRQHVIKGDAHEPYTN